MPDRAAGFVTFPHGGSSVLKPDLSSLSLLLLEQDYLFWDIVYDKYYAVLIFIGSHLRDCHEFKKSKLSNNIRTVKI